MEAHHSSERVHAGNMPAAERPPSSDWRAACRALARAVRRRPEAPSRVHRVEVSVPEVNPLSWLDAQPTPRGFWKGREAETVHAFTGVADRIEEPAQLCSRLEQADGRSGAAPLRYYGGVRFDTQRPAADGWEAFGAGAFVLPRFELIQQEGEGTKLVCHLSAGDDIEIIATQVEQLAAPSRAGVQPSLSSLPGTQSRRDCPAHPAWRQGVNQALEAIERGTFQKVVLARRTTFRFERPLPPVMLLGRLRALAPKGFAFLVQPARAGAFLGVSPERLFRQSGRRVWSEAVAGTRPRGRAAEADAALREELLKSDKDRREHAFVQRYVHEALEPLSVSLEEREAVPLTLRRGRHLYARLEGRLRSDTTPAEVLRALHPTPAVGGLPGPAAQRFIREHEPFDRGWYAAPVGWIGREDDGALAAELAVGIRSGLLRADDGNGRLDLFAGAGLVKGSEADAEWEEVEQKLGNFMALFGQERLA